jgi:hypothetical protein
MLSRRAGLEAPMAERYGRKRLRESTLTLDSIGDIFLPRAS